MPYKVFSGPITEKFSFVSSRCLQEALRGDLEQTLKATSEKIVNFLEKEKLPEKVSREDARLHKLKKFDRFGTSTVDQVWNFLTFNFGEDANGVFFAISVW